MTKTRGRQEEKKEDTLMTVTQLAASQQTGRVRDCSVGNDVTEWSDKRERNGNTLSLFPSVMTL
jgi:hypothetical protein